MQKLFYIGTNWKMHLTHSEARGYFSELLPLMPGLSKTGYRLFVIPPFVSLPFAREAIDLAGADLKLGAQNVHWETGDEATGEISLRILKDVGVDLIEIGHSERRQKFGETDALVNLKVRAVLAENLTALICIGESAAEKSADGGAAVLARQVREALRGVSSEELRNVIFAYEPVWAIGVAGKPAEPVYVQERHAFIRRVVGEIYGPVFAAEIPILFGGSIRHENFASYAQLPDVNGLFIGRAAWTASSFAKMVKNVQALLLSPV